MAHDMGTIEDEIPKGDAVELPFTVKEDGSTKDITSYSADYYIVRKDTIVDREDNNADISITFPDPGNGELLVKLESGVTSDYPDHVDEILRLEDTQGNKITFVGHLNFEELPV